MAQGSVSVSAAGTVTKSGMAGDIYDQLVAMLALVSPTGIVPTGPAGYPLKHGLALQANAISAAIYPYISAAAGPGTMAMFGGSSAPTGWLLCDHSSYLRADYPDLFAAIGTAHGAVDGTHFNVPDMRGRVPLGVGTGDAADATAHTLAQKAGTETHTLTTSEMPSHSHHASNADSEIKFIEKTIGAGSLTATAAGTDWSEVRDTATTGSDGAHNNLPPYLGINFIIKT